MIVLIYLRDEIYDIIGSKFFMQKFKNIGYIMKIFYQINNLSKLKDSFNYSFGFNGYISNMINIKQEYNKKSINLCKFSNKNTSFKEAYYPTIKNPVKRLPDITKTMNNMNWKPKVSRKKGLENTFNYFRSLSLDELNKKEHKFE